MTEVEELRPVELVNGEVTTTSRQVAEVFGKEHQHVLRDIDNLVKQIGGVQNWTDPKTGVVTELTESAQNYADPMFQEETYIHQQNHQEYRQFRMNKDGFTLLVSGFTGKKALKFKIDYIAKFNAMEAALKQQQFFLPETTDQQNRREQLAIAKQNSENAKSREIRAWVRLSKNDPDVVKAVAPKVMSLLLDVPESQIQLEPEIRYPYTAAEVGVIVGIEAYEVGTIAQRLDLKASYDEGSNRYTRNVRVKDHAGKFTHKWLYSREGVREIGRFLELED